MDGLMRSSGLETFTSLEDMRAKSTHFVGQYNDLSARKKRNKSLEQINPARILNNSLKIPRGNYHLPRERYTSSERLIMMGKSLS